jgi:hypothetical protein
MYVHIWKHLTQQIYAAWMKTTVTTEQGDQIIKIFAYWVVVYFG